jgi:glycosyltransferase involved in cell wall biosynthesis
MANINSTYGPGVAPLLSAIIPLYNKRDSIERTVQSVWVAGAQVPIEAVVVDDGSTDGSGDIALRLAEKYPWLRVIQQENQGASVARNNACGMAKSPIYAFLDADDVWRPNHGVELLRGFVQSDAGLVVCPFERYTDGVLQKRMGWGIYPDVKVKHHFRALAFGDMYMATSGTAIRASVFDRVGGFDPRLRNGQDRALWGAAYMEAGIYRTGQVTAEWHVDSSNSLMSKALTDLAPKYETWLEEKIDSLAVEYSPAMEMPYGLLKQQMIENLVEDSVSIGIHARKNGLEHIVEDRMRCLIRFGRADLAERLDQVNEDTPDYKRASHGPRWFDASTPQAEPDMVGA